MYEQRTVPLHDLAAATVHVVLPQNFAYLTKVQHFAAGGAAVGTDLPIVYSNVPAAGQAGFVAPNNLYLGTASAAGDMYDVIGIPRGAMPQLT